MDDPEGADTEPAVLLFRRQKVAVLVIPGGREDRNVEDVNGWARLRPDEVAVIDYRSELGPGGNQKRAFRDAILNRFDAVIVLRGDQPLSDIDRLLDPLANGEADAVIGVGRPSADSRPSLSDRFTAGVWSLLVGPRLDANGTCCRAYSVAVLAQLPLNANVDDDRFDDEVIAQLAAGRFRIHEAASPGAGADGPRSKYGFRRAWGALKTAAAYRLHKAGLLYDRRFDLKRGRQYTYKNNRYSSHRRIAALAGAPSAGRRSKLLDVGCGGGFLAASLARQGFEVCGVDAYDSPEARRYCKRFVVADVESDGWLQEGETADTIVFADVLEHLREPETMLLKMRRRLPVGGRVIASTGNVAHVFIRLSLLVGVFRYTERGILDRTHVRLFTTRSFRRLFVDCGYKITKVRYCPIPFENLFPRWRRLADALSALNMAFVWIWPSLFAYQTVVEAKPSGAPAEWLSAGPFVGEFDEPGERRRAA